MTAMTAVQSPRQYIFLSPRSRLGKGSSVRECGDGTLRRLTLFTLLHAADAVLELLDVSPESNGFSGDIIGLRALQVGGLDVETRSEGSVTSAGNDDGADVGVDGEGVHDGAELQPHGLNEGIHLIRPVDLDMSNVGGGSGDEEVFVSFGSHAGRSCRDAGWGKRGMGCVGKSTLQLNCRMGGCS
jgi:hypothetical protein